MDTRSRYARAGIVFPLVLIVVTTIYLAAAFGISSSFSGDGEMSPRSIPILTAVLMYAALVVVLFHEIRSPADAAAEGAEDGSLVRPVLVVVATAAYILLFRPLGYSLATLLFVAALFVTFDFETRRPVRFGLCAVGVTAVFYGLFAMVFGVRLPTFPGAGF